MALIRIILRLFLGSYGMSGVIGICIEILKHVGNFICRA